MTMNKNKRELFFHLFDEGVYTFILYSGSLLCVDDNQGLQLMMMTLESRSNKLKTYLLAHLTFLIEGVKFEAKGQGQIYLNLFVNANSFYNV